MNTFHVQTGLLKTISHPTRLAVLDLLRDGEQCVCHMEAMLNLRQAYISQHLMLLRQAGLVGHRRVGLNLYYRVVKPDIFSVLDAVNIASGGPANRTAHIHAHTPCPCPKCSAKQSTSLRQAVVRS